MNTKVISLQSAGKASDYSPIPEVQKAEKETLVKAFLFCRPREGFSNIWNWWIMLSHASHERTLNFIVILAFYQIAITPQDHYHRSTVKYPHQYPFSAGCGRQLLERVYAPVCGYCLNFWLFDSLTFWPFDKLFNTACGWPERIWAPPLQPHAYWPRLFPTQHWTVPAFLWWQQIAKSECTLPPPCPKRKTQKYRKSAVDAGVRLGQAAS